MFTALAVLPIALVFLFARAPRSARMAPVRVRRDQARG
jgi:hypothetical protein